MRGDRLFTQIKEYAINDARRRNLSKDTSESRLNNLMRLFYFLGERELTIENVRAYADWLNTKGLEPGTIHLALRTCRAFIRWLATNSLIEDWAKQIELPRLHRKLL